MKKSRRPRRLIALQMTDQVPCRRQSFRSGALPFPLLDTILAKVPNPRFIRFADRTRRMRLGHPDEGDLLRAPPCARRRYGNPLLNSQQLFPHRSLRHVRIRILARAALQRGVSAVRLAFGR